MGLMESVYGMYWPWYYLYLEQQYISSVTILKRMQRVVYTV